MKSVLLLVSNKLADSGGMKGEAAGKEKKLHNL